MTRIFASLHPFFEDGPINGRKKANAGFMTALLEKDPFDQYHFFVANPNALRQCWQNLPQAPAALKRCAVHALHRTELPQRLRDTPYHVFHFSDPVTGFAPLMAARNRWAAEIFPITCVNHTISYVDYAAPLLGHIWHGCTARDAIGCNSTAAREVLRRWYAHARTAYALPPACREPRLEVIAMGAPPENALQDGECPQAQRLEMRRRLKLDDNTVMLLLFGRIAVDDKMDPQPLLMALRRVREAHPHLSCTLVISGAMATGDTTPDFLHALARLWGLNLSILPNPNLKEKRALFAAADIFLSPSDNIQETFGLTLVEAAQAGLPAIASHWDGYRDIVEHEVTGLLIPTLAPAHSPELDAMGYIIFDNQHHHLRSQRTAVHVPAMAEAIGRLAQSADMRHRMGQAAKQRAQSFFTLSHVVEQWLALWEELRATPLTLEEESTARTAQHPQLLPFGEAFAPFATSALQEDTLLRCTPMGEALRQGKLPMQALSLTITGITEESLRPLLVLTRKECTVAQLAARCSLSPEGLGAHILWALKHDLLECPAPFVEL